MTTQPRHAFSDYEAAVEAAFDRGWTDGLPIMPPTEAKVALFLQHAGLAPATVLGHVVTRDVDVTAEQVAANAVMAGCKPEYMPVVVAAMRALLHERSHLHSTSGSLTGPAHAIIVNGPIRRDLEINCKLGVFGPGFRANATIGRAVRLVIRNVCKSIPGFLDRATFSTPARYSFCFGENEEDSPWIPLHAERGLSPQQSAVTVNSFQKTTAATDLASRTPQAICDSIVKAVRRGGVNADEWLGGAMDVILVVGMEHMRYFAEAGWSKKQMRTYLFPRLVEPPRPDEERVGLTSPDHILIVAAGGQGIAQTHVLHPHRSWAITVPIEPSPLPLPQ
ncbi:MAG: hypothetical protein EXR49_06940 [Dehalococcoidia bacterium]|nr:hypothetical protein [Dehalococcoidia bacterium]